MTIQLHDTTQAFAITTADGNKVTINVDVVMEAFRIERLSSVAPGQSPKKETEWLPFLQRELEADHGVKLSLGQCCSYAYYIRQQFGELKKKQDGVSESPTPSSSTPSP